MTDHELNEMIMALQNATALSRIGHGELLAAFAHLAELGYTITKPAVAD